MPLQVLRKEKKSRKKVLLATTIILIDCKKETQTVKKKNNSAMPLLHGSNIEFGSDNFNDDDDDEYDHDLVIRRTTSYSTRIGKSASKTKLSARQTSDSIGVDQAIACALKSRPKAFHYTQKHLQYLPPSIQHLAVCDSIRELDLHGNQLKSLPNEIEKFKSIEICDLGEIKYFSSDLYDNQCE
jgi:hypothetical protein